MTEKRRFIILVMQDGQLYRTTEHNTPMAFCWADTWTASGNTGALDQLTTL